MARLGRKDRGLLSKVDSSGKLMWYVRLYYEGKERRFGAFTTKTAAREFYEKAKQEQKTGRFFPERYQRAGYETVQSVIDQYVANLSGKKSTTIADERRYATWWKVRLAGKRLNQITSDVLEDVKRHMTAKNRSPQTILHYLKFLRHVLYATIGKSKLVDNPFEHVKLPKIRPGRTRFLSIPEEVTLCEAMGARYRPWVRFAILTGLRRSEQFGLRWSDVDLELGIITLLRPKAGHVQYVQLTDEAKEILRSMESWQRSVWVFPSENPATHLDPRNFYRRVFAPAVKAAKLESVTWHTLRHTFASRLAMNGAGDSTIATLLRHSGTALVARYAHLSPSHLKSALEGVARFGKIEAIQNGTVTKTGISTRGGEPEHGEVIEKTGRGERI